MTVVAVQMSEWAEWTLPLGTDGLAMCTGIGYRTAADDNYWVVAHYSCDRAVRPAPDPSYVATVTWVRDHALANLPAPSTAAGISYIVYPVFASGNSDPSVLAMADGLQAAFAAWGAPAPERETGNALLVDPFGNLQIPPNWPIDSEPIEGHPGCDVPRN